ncbi:DUF559 domain-containing protein [Gracilimonas sp. Q87]|uniref:DUF559 domain-containing protein n=1 Tax=Gracilimonas sp. Q87 TaxID=3384766 RepID=UPI0039842A94
MQYPNIQTSVELDVLVEKGKTYRKPVKPKFNYKEPPYPNPTYGGIYHVAVFSSLIAGMFVLLGIASTVAGSEAPIGALGPAVIIFLLSIFVVVGQTNSKNEEIDKYNDRLDFYKSKNKEYEQELALYEKKLENYYSKIRAKDSLGDKKHIENSLLEFYSTIMKPRETSSVVKKGKMESVLQNHLEKYFGNKIKIDKALFHDDFDKIKTPYIPDIIYHNSESGLCIDIEIDEKYSADGQLIHYQHNSHDDQRDQFFTSQGWIVIRFAEQQVVENPKGCVLEVLEVVEKYDPSFVKEYKHTELQNIASKLSPVDQWKKKSSNNNSVGYTNYDFNDDLDDDLPF